MSKTILITGATDGIGLLTAKLLYQRGHNILLHGRNAEKLVAAKHELLEVEREDNGPAKIKTYLADFSRLADVRAFANNVSEKHQNIDVLINNAGVFGTAGGLTEDGYELRFAVNAIAPYLLTNQLIKFIPDKGRVINLSSAAQSSVDPDAIKGAITLSDGAAYAQSKLLLTIWSRRMGLLKAETGPLIVAVNPKSFLASKMVKEAYGMAGKDLSEGANILVRAALSDEFERAGGKYYDNDIGRFSEPHPDALNEQIVDQLMRWLNSELSDYLQWFINQLYQQQLFPLPCHW